MVLFTPAGEAVSERLATLGSVSDDASGRERLGQYAELLNTDNGTLIGNGFSPIDVVQPGAAAQDGQFVIAWYAMGLIVGIVSIAGLLWAAVLAIRGGAAARHAGRGGGGRDRGGDGRAVAAGGGVVERDRVPVLDLCRHRRGAAAVRTRPEGPPTARSDIR